MIARMSLSLLIMAAALLCPRPAMAQAIYKNVSSATLERILGELNIKYQKSFGKDKQGKELPGVHFYHYTNKAGFQVRLHNYNGKDLWIEALFTDVLPLEEVNRWNARAKFSRCVQLNNNNKITTSLEYQVDCLGGVTDAIVRQFIVRFDTEIRDFADFAKKSAPR
jgi:hypothetical protein